MLVRELYLKHFEETSEETGSKLLMTKMEMASVFGPLDIIINYAKALYAQVGGGKEKKGEGEGGKRRERVED